MNTLVRFFKDESGATMVDIRRIGGFDHCRGGLHNIHLGWADKFSF